MKAPGLWNYWRRDLNARSPSLPLHAASYLVLLAAILGLNSALHEPAFALAAALAAGLGQLVSVGMRRAGRSARLVEIVSLAACLVLAARMLSSEYGSWFIPNAASAIPELRMAVLLLWIEILRSFTLVSDDAAVFSAVPAATLLSLAAHANINPDLLAYFLLYLTATCFLLVHRNALSSRCGNTTRFLSEQMRAAAAIALLAVLAGAVISIPLKLAATGTIAAVSPELVRFRPTMVSTFGAESDAIQISMGPIRLSERPMLLVRLEAQGHDTLTRQWYWRGRVYDRYTGRGWQSTSTLRAVKLTDGPNFIAEPDVHHSAPKLRVKQSIQALASAGRTIYGAAEPARVSLPTDKALVDSANCWRIPGVWTATGEMLSYEVVSHVPDAKPAELDRAGTDYPVEVRRKFLQRSNSTLRAAGLAHDITRGQHTPYARARAIEDYLSTHYAYDTNAAPAPRTTDAVEHFLFSSKRGYCDVFASAMVVMCRELGIPARLATGFASGSYDPDARAFRVKEADRHAWAEVYFPQHGWIAFDPVAPLGEPRQGTWQDLSRGASQLWALLIGSSLTPVALLLVLTVALFCIGGTGRVRRKVRIGRPREGSSESPVDGVRRRTAREYELLCRDIARSGLPGRGNLTPGEYRDLLLSILSPVSDAADTIRAATHEFEQVRYGGCQPSEELPRYRRALRTSLRRGLPESVRQEG